MREYTEREKWFIERVGKVVYRNKTSCPCDICNNVANNGLIIADHNHALYLSEIEAEYNIEGHPLKYCDTKEEVTEFINHPHAG
jgi:hypothetical protein